MNASYVSGELLKPERIAREDTTYEVSEQSRWLR